MAKILITGGSGLVGNRLSEILAANGHQVTHLSRSSNPHAKYPTFKWSISDGEIDQKAFEGVDHIVHLAGAGVADKRWTSSRKKVILSSRVDAIGLLNDYVLRLGIKLKSFVSASGIGLYGADTGDMWLTEESGEGKDFLADVVKQWEAEADLFTHITKVTKVRIGVVLSEEGGALPEIMRPIRLFAGAPLGTGKQYMSWIHIDDLCELFRFVIENNIEGSVNATAPNPVTNKELTQSIAQTISKPLILPNVPAFVMKLMLGEMAQIVLGGNRVSSERIVEKGFKFRFTDVNLALQDLLS
ncbi:MAG: TIGR01777 family oxidoreductase [Cyclobacteriaceae bacterium]